MGWSVSPVYDVVRFIHSTMIGCLCLSEDSQRNDGNQLDNSAKSLTCWSCEEPEEAASGSSSIATRTESSPTWALSVKVY